MTAPLGHNNPPEPTAFEALSIHLADLMTEARAWCDGEPIETQAQADTLHRLMEDLRTGRQDFDIARKTEAKVFDDGKSEIQARYNPILKSSETAVAAVKAALTPFLKAQEAVKQAKADEARRIAQEAQEAAAAAARAVDYANLEQREAAEALIHQALAAEAQAKRAESDRARVKGGERAASLRTYYTPRLDDLMQAVRYFWSIDEKVFEVFVTDLARKEILAGKRTIQGFTVIEEQRVV